jgi:membrane protease subunit (stomatin/prohibitin family)
LALEKGTHGGQLTGDSPRDLIRFESKQMALVDRIKFDSPSDTILVWKFPSEELHLGSQLIVNQSQEAVFVKGGEVFDVFGPGTHTLATGNLPLLSAVVDFPFGGKTPFSAEVWYVNKTVKRDLRWGTTSPVPLLDPEFNYPISVRAYGRYGVRVTDSRLFVREIVGTLRWADSEKLNEYFVGEIHQKFSAALANFITGQSVSIFKINGLLNELASASLEAISPEFARFGIEVVNYNVERVSIPDDELQKFQAVFGRRMEIDQISKAQVGQAYTTMRTFDTLEKAAANEGGGAGALLAGGLGLGVGVGAGVPLGQKLGESLGVSASENESDPVKRLRTLKSLFDQSLISAEEYDLRRKAILEAL